MPTEQELVDEINHVAELLDKKPSQNDMKEHGEYSTRAYVNEFGKWNNALEVAGFEPRYHKLPKEKLIEDLHRLEEELGRRPTSDDVVERGNHSITTYMNRFGSWAEAAREAGYEPRHYGVSDERLLEELQDVSESVGGKPTTNDIAEHAVFSPTTYNDRFGSLNAALQKAGVV